MLLTYLFLMYRTGGSLDRLCCPVVRSLFWLELIRLLLINRLKICVVILVVVVVVV